MFTPAKSCETHRAVACTIEVRHRGHSGCSLKLRKHHRRGTGIAWGLVDSVPLKVLAWLEESGTNTSSSSANCPPGPEPSSVGPVRQIGVIQNCGVRASALEASHFNLPPGGLHNYGGPNGCIPFGCDRGSCRTVLSSSKQTAFHT